VKELNNDACFTIDAVKWSASSLRTGQSIWSTCAGTYLLGGYGVIGPNSGPYQGSFFYRTYTNLAPHSMLYFAVTMWAIDSWNSGVDYFQIQFDSATPISGWTTFDYQSYPSYITDLCGDSSFREVPNMRLFGRAVHSGGSLTVKFISQFDSVSTNEAFGIRNFNILFTPSPTALGATSYFCGLASVTIGALGCPCPEGTYLTSSSTCASCNGACVSCFGSGANQCYECQPNYIYDGNTCSPSCTSPCTSCRATGTNQCSACSTGYVLYDDSTCILPSQCVLPLSVGDCARSCDSPCPRDQFVYANLSCSSNCLFPLQQGLVLTATKLCIYPCAPGEYLYWDGICETDCPAPLVQRFQPGETYCDYKCAVSAFLYWNGSCSSKCDPPLVVITQHSRQFCTYPCLPNQYLYWDGTCLYSCPSPLAIRINSGGDTYCDYLCPVSQFLLWNGTCVSTCDPPLISVTQQNRQFCKFPCAAGFSLDWTGNCVNSCPFPLAVRKNSGGDTYCDYLCPVNQFLLWNGTCVSTCDFPLVQKIDRGRQFCTYPCAKNQYLYWDGTCVNSCPFPLAPRTEPGKDAYCDYLCPVNQFLLWNGTCVNTCDPPLVVKTDRNRQYCTYPCAKNQFLYWDGTCLNSCPFPLAIRSGPGKDVYCDYLCAVNQYMLWNGTCSNNCDFPLVVKIDRNRQYCAYPCTPNQYLYWDGVCTKNCPSPLAPRIEPGNDVYCGYLCAVTDFLYWNGTCSSSCPTPLAQKVERNRQYCNYPCAQSEYLYPNSTCAPQCKVPYASRIEAGKNYCYRMCPGEEFVLWIGGCIANCNPPLRVMSNSSGTFCFSPCDNPSNYYDPEHKVCQSFCEGSTEKTEFYKICHLKQRSLYKLLHHIRYVKVQFPSKLENITIIRATNILSLRVAANMFTSVGEWQNKFSLPSVFDYYGLPSSFLENFSNDLILLGMIITGTLVIALLEQLLSRMGFTTISNFLERIRVITQLNLPLMIIAHNTGDIIFFSINEFRTYDPTAKDTFLSFALAIVMLVICVVFYALGFFLAYQAQIAKRTIFETGSYRKYAKFVITWQHFQVLFRGYDDSNLLSQSFFMIYCIRNALPMIIASSLYRYPQLQSISFVAISGLMLAYLVFQRPIKKTVDLVNMILLEVIILFADISLLVFNILDTKEIESPKTREFFGEVIIIADYGFTILASMALFTKFVMILRQGYHFHNQNNSRQRKLALMQLLFLPIQQGSFGFEQVQVERFRKIPEPEKIPDENEMVRLNNSNIQYHKQHSVLHKKNRLELATNLDRDDIFVQDVDSSPVRVSDLTFLRPDRAYQPYRPKQLNDHNNYYQSHRPLKRHRKNY